MVLGRFDGRRLRLEETHRFDNGPVRVGASLYWDLLRLWTEVLDGLRQSRERAATAITSVGVDTWGVDYALMGSGDVLLGNPHHYRDARTEGMMERAIDCLGREEIFQRTGLQFLPFNTLYQLMAEQRSGAPLLECAERLLMIPDVFHWLLSGRQSNELTNATTTQCYDPRRRAWDTGLLDRLGLPTHLLGDISPPGTRLGPLRREIADETGLARTEVVLPGTHDTASAVMAVPAPCVPSEKPDWCYISSGTWSLMGVELSAPLITEDCLKLNFTNEGGVAGSTRLLKNIAGLWLVQECRRVWNQAGRSWSWQQLSAAAEEAEPLVSLVDPDAADFLAPGEMPSAIREFCRRRGEAVPADEGAVIRCALDSLALKYRLVLSQLEQLVGSRIETIHIVGGGTQNRLLCQATADACGRAVIAGPVEATATGNLMMQAIAAGDVGSIHEARDVIRHSFAVDHYKPRDATRWDEAYGRFTTLCQAAGG